MICKCGKTLRWEDGAYCAECMAAAMARVRAVDPPKEHPVIEAVMTLPAFQEAEPDYKRLLSGLLAVLHRDGGHFELEHGTERAVSAAIDKWVDRRLAEDRVVTWEAIRKVCASEDWQMDLALKLRALGFSIVGLPDQF